MHREISLHFKFSVSVLYTHCFLGRRSQAFAQCLHFFLPCFNPSFAGVFFYLSSAVNPIIYNLLSRRFRAAFRNVVSPTCKWCHPRHRPQGPPAQKIIFLTECHLVELTEDAGPQFPGQSSIHNTNLTTAPCAGEVP